MELRPAVIGDWDAVLEIDGTVESHRYLHVDQSGEGLDVKWSLQDRPLRERLIQSRPMDEDQQCAFRQFTTGIDEGLVTVAVHDEQVVGLLLAQPQRPAEVLKLMDLRVEFDHRRQGLAMALLYGAIAAARENGLRAIAADVPANNGPAHALLAKLGFTLTGLDTHRWSNHDLVKETVTLFWYLAVD